MSEPLMGDRLLVGEWDPLAGFVVRGEMPGPAGTAGIDFANGITLDVDAAVPTRSCLLAVDNPAGGAQPLSAGTLAALGTLLGEDRLDALLGLARGPRHRSSLPGTSLPGFVSSAPPGVMPRLARLALARRSAEDPHFPELAKAVATLEAAVLAIDLDPAIGFGSDPDAWAADGADRLLALAGGRRGVGPLGRGSASALAGLLRGVVRRLGTQGRDLALVRLAAAVEATARDESPGGDEADTSNERFALAMATADFLRAPEPSRQLRAVPPPPAVDVDEAAVCHSAGAGASVSVDVASDCELRARLKARRGAGEGLMARVFRGAALVATAPFENGGRGPEAWLLITPGTASEVIVDVARHPGAPGPSAPTFHGRRALDAGRRATRAARLGRTPEARGHWEESARRWSAAGDDERHHLALGYAAAPPRFDPLVSDHLAD